jgi:beta-lactam-binding protein with PASTA domain
MASIVTDETTTVPDSPGDYDPPLETTQIHPRDPVSVPNVSGEDLYHALAGITNADLIPHVAPVSATVPAVGASVKSGSNVWLVVTNQTKVPNVIGLGADAALATMLNAGLYVTMAETLRDELPECPPHVTGGQVGGTVPPVGTAQPIGGNVTLLVVMEKQTAEVPDIVGFSVIGAERELHRVGLNSVRYPPFAQGGWIVRDTNPRPGSMVKLGNAILLNTMRVSAS